MVQRFWAPCLCLLLFSAVLLAPLSVSADAPEVAQVQADTGAIAARILQLTNEARQQNGLPPMESVAYLSAAATGHSKEMIDLNYFSHTSPTPGRTKTKDRIHLANGWDTRVAENIYRTKGVPAQALADRAMDAWIKSPSHYKNLMDPTLNSIGVGIVPAGDEFAVTQVFSQQTIVVDKLVSSPGAGGYEIVLQGHVREGTQEGALFINDAPKDTFTADGGGRFEVRGAGPAGSQVSVSQKKAGTNSYSQNLAFPIEAGIAR